jgi:hypothetical protein
MKRFVVLAGAALAASGAAAEKPAQFWNLTSGTVMTFRLSHAGSGEYGDNLAIRDPDGIDHDERLKLPNLPNGAYDVQIGFKGGRVCLARHITIEAGKVFSIEDKELINCVKK